MKELKFIHITKTAGTTIENDGKSIGIDWGRFHTEYGWWHKVANRIDQDVLDKYDWFIVVRNPYDRVISEVHCFWNHGFSRNPMEKSKKNYNEFIKKTMEYMLSNGATQYGNPEGDHWDRQHMYYTKGCNIVRFENLVEDFSKLMSKYNIALEIQTHVNMGGNRDYFDVSDITDSNILLINEVYHKDFEMFNYEKILI